MSTSKSDRRMTPLLQTAGRRKDPRSGHPLLRAVVPGSLSKDTMKLNLETLRFDA